MYVGGKRWKLRTVHYWLSRKFKLRRIAMASISLGVGNAITFEDELELHER